MKTVDAGAVTVAPTRLKRVTADDIEPGQLKAVIGVAHVWSQNVSENIGLATTGRAWTSPPEKLEIKIRLGSVVPLNGELITNLLNVGRLQTHGV